jgi:hypothetical protein
MVSYNTSDMARLISYEISREAKTHRLYALLWLWDYVVAKAKDGVIELTEGQHAILMEE